MNSLDQYNAVKAQLRPGDHVFFYGTGLLSDTIEFVSDGGPSHCATVRNGLQDGDEVRIVECTILNGLNGVQTNLLDRRIANYDDSPIVACLLSDEARKTMDLFNFYKFIGQCEGEIKYDVPDLFEFLARMTPVIGSRLFQVPHDKVMVCSAWCTALDEASGLLRGFNYTKMMPEDLLQIKMYSKAVPLYKEAKLVRFNTL